MQDERLVPGKRRGRFTVVRDRDGRRYALAATAVVAICDDADGGTIILMPGGRVIAMDEDIETVLAWVG